MSTAPGLNMVLRALVLLAGLGLLALMVLFGAISLREGETRAARLAFCLRS